MGRVTRMSRSRHTCEWVMSHTYEWVVSPTSLINESHKWISCDKTHKRVSSKTHTFMSLNNSWVSIVYESKSFMSRNVSCDTNKTHKWVSSLNYETHFFFDHLWVVSFMRLINESRDTYEWVMSHTYGWVVSQIYKYVTSHVWISHVTHVGMSHVTRMNESCHTHTNESCHTYERVVSHVWMSQVTRMNEPCHVGMNESCHTYEWVMWHVWKSHVTRMDESRHTYE